MIGQNIKFEPNLSNFVLYSTPEMIEVIPKTTFSHSDNHKTYITVKISQNILTY